MCMWILIIIAIVAVFNFNDLPKWSQKVKENAPKLKNFVMKKIEEIKNKKKG